MQRKITLLNLDSYKDNPELVFFLKDSHFKSRSFLQREIFSKNPTLWIFTFAKRICFKGARIMMRRHNNIDKRSLLQLCLLCFFVSCTGEQNKGKSKDSFLLTNTQDFIEIPLGLASQNSLSLEGSSLNLSTAVADITVSLSGCASAYSVSGFLVPNLESERKIRIIRSDKNCTVELDSFRLDGELYTPKTGFEFAAWTPGSFGIYIDENSGKELRLSLSKQITPAGALDTDQVSFEFTDIDSRAAPSLGSVIAEPGISLGGDVPPNFIMTSAEFIGINTDGSANLAFSLECGDPITGSSPADYKCSEVLITSELDYMIIRDEYGGSLTIDDADTLFTTPTNVNIHIPINGSDDFGNTLSNGGIATDTIATGSTPILPDNLNHFLVFRRTDGAGKAFSYLYFPFSIPDPTDSIVVGVVGCGTIFAGGSGTSGDPWQIATRTHLENTVNCTSAGSYFIQMNDIDIGGSADPWVPITMYGRYNGAGYNISNPYINDPGATLGHYIGFFTQLAGSGRITNVNLTGIDFTIAGAPNGNGHIGGLAGAAGHYSSITNSSVSGTFHVKDTLASHTYFGGITAVTRWNTGMSNLKSSLDIIWSDTNSPNSLQLGGIIGYQVAGGLSNAEFTGSITLSGNGRSDIGGLVGKKLGGVSNSYVNATISNTPSSGTQYFGGTDGWSENSTVASLSRCFAMGTITLDGVNNSGSAVRFGGLSGVSRNTSHSYAMMNMNLLNPENFGSINYGGLAGSGGGVSNSYAANPSMTGTSAPASAGFTNGTCNANCYLYENGNVPAQTLANLTSYTTVGEMQTQSNFAFFNSNWRMPSANPLAPNGLLSPVLAWQCGKNGIVCP